MAKETETLLRQAARQWHTVERRQRKHLEEALKAKSELEKLEAIIEMRAAKTA